MKKLMVIAISVTTLLTAGDMLANAFDLGKTSTAFQSLVAKIQQENKGKRGKTHAIIVYNGSSPITDVTETGRQYPYLNDLWAGRESIPTNFMPGAQYKSGKYTTITPTGMSDTVKLKFKYYTLESNRLGARYYDKQKGWIKPEIKTRDFTYDTADLVKAYEDKLNDPFYNFYTLFFYFQRTAPTQSGTQVSHLAVYDQNGHCLRDFNLEK
jgi:hypothetical protein